MSSSWGIDPATRRLLRLRAVTRAIGRSDWGRGVLEAEEMLDEQAEDGDALGLLARCLLEIGDCENAAEAFDDHLRLSPHTAEAWCGCASARFESCDLQGALDAAHHCLALDGSWAEAHYIAGLCLQRLNGDLSSEADHHLQHAYRLDPDAFSPPMELSDTVLRDAIEEALNCLDPALLEFWAPVPLQIQDTPTLAELTASPVPLPPTIAGFYVGTPAAGTRPAALRLFRKNLARSGDRETLITQLVLLFEEESMSWTGEPLMSRA